MKAEEVRIRYAARDRDFSKANLKRADLGKATLHKAELRDTNLIAVQAIDTNFTAAILPRAYLEGWNIDN